MEIVVKKSKKNPNGIVTLEQLQKELEISKIQELLEKVNSLKDKLEELNIKTKSTLSKKELSKAIKEALMLLHTPINIKNVGSLEKNKDVKEGTLYYNTTKGLRLKNKSNWITIN